MLIKGAFLHFPELGKLEILEDYLLAFNDDGFITYFGEATASASVELMRESPVAPMIIPDGSFLMPNFVDLHLHAPQFLYQGNGLHLPLMEWLDEYAFKAEERLDADGALARRVYTRLARRLIESGTGAVLLFGTIKEGTNLILAEVMQTAGIRAFVGKLSMDISSRETYVEASAEASLRSVTSFIRRCSQIVDHLPIHQRLVEPVITPRFVPTCSDDLLKGLGNLSATSSVRVQSHLAEAHDEVDWVRQERGIDDIDVFDQHRLLTPRTVQAHCTFLGTSDLARVAARGTAIAHCPLSNAYFSAEPFHLREALQQGVKVGLGTDIAGGYSLDIMNAMRQAVAVSKMREGARILARRAEGRDGNESNENLAINWKESLYLATQGGAHALGLPLGSGNFQVGAPFDAQHIRVFDTESCSGIGGLDFFDFDQGLVGNRLRVTVEMVEKWWCIGDVRNRAGMWVQGKKVQGKKVPRDSVFALGAE